LEGIEAVVLRTGNWQPTLWESILPAGLLVLPAENLTRAADALASVLDAKATTGIIRTQVINIPARLAPDRRPQREPPDSRADPTCPDPIKIKTRAEATSSCYALDPGSATLKTCV